MVNMSHLEVEEDVGVHAKYSLAVQIVIACLITLIVVTGAIGNFLVIFAISTQRKLHSRANFLIASLAAADFLVSILVTPFFAFMAMHSDQLDSWWMSSKLTCQIFVFLDVTCCTASIMHLCAIAWVRYNTVSTISLQVYSKKFGDVVPTIGFVWLMAALLSFAPYLIFPTESVSMPLPTMEDDGKENMTKVPSLDNGSYHQNITIETRLQISHLSCAVNSNKAYRVVATTVAFYGPLLVILIIYVKMARIAWSRIGGGKSAMHCDKHNDSSTDSLSRNSTMLESDGRPVKIIRRKTTYYRMAIENAYRSSVNILHSEFKLKTNRENPPKCEVCLPEPTDNRQSEIIDNSGANYEPSYYDNIENDLQRRESLMSVTLHNSKADPCKYEINCNLAPHEYTELLTPTSTKLPRRNLVTSTPMHKWKSESNFNSIKSTHCDNLNSDTSRYDSRRFSRDVPSRLSSRRASKSCSDCGITSWKRSVSVKLRKERKVIKTLGMVIGAFVVCWLPFFLKELILPFCTTCSIDTWVETVINWLGYVNSALNPFIYAFANKDFNRAFKHVFKRSNLSSIFNNTSNN